MDRLNSGRHYFHFFEFSHARKSTLLLANSILSSPLSSFHKVSGDSNQTCSRANRVRANRIWNSEMVPDRSIRTRPKAHLLNVYRPVGYPFFRSNVNAIEDTVDQVAFFGGTIVVYYDCLLPNVIAWPRKMSVGDDHWPEYPIDLVYLPKVTVMFLHWKTFICLVESIVRRARETRVIWFAPAYLSWCYKCHGT